MLEWLGSFAISERTPRRVELALTRATSWLGWAVAVLALSLVPAAYALAPWLALVSLVVMAAGLAVATVRRRFIFDADDGLLRVEQRILGVRSRLAVPLFHLRALVVVRDGDSFALHVERRTGARIFVDESRHLERLLTVAAAICSATELRLVRRDG